MTHSLRSLKFCLTTIVLWAALSSPTLAQTLHEQKFQLPAAAEVQLEFTAAAPGTAWVEKGREAAVVSVSVDDQYHQELFLFAGAEPFTYRALLGRRAAGTHSLKITLNRPQSAASVTKVELKDIKVTGVTSSATEFQALAHAPILYARPNSIGRFSDIPLLMWYELTRPATAGGPTRIRYSVIFSNEDGGTQTTALMARWGRTTDIEWVYEVTLDPAGKVLTEIFQGLDHKTTVFRGAKEAAHPVLLVGSDNNNFVDQGQSAMRFALRPIEFELSRSSREEIMDHYPWTYQVMAAEMIREGRIIAAEAGAPEANEIGMRIVDLRRFLYLEGAAVQRGAALSFAVKLKNDPRWYPSDLGVDYFRIDRSEYFRTTIKLPARVTPDQIEQIVVRCHLAEDQRPPKGNPKSAEQIGRVLEAESVLTALNKIFMLDENFQPAQVWLSQSAKQFDLTRQLPLKLRVGEMVELYNAMTSSAKVSRSYED